MLAQCDIGCIIEKEFYLVNNYLIKGLAELMSERKDRGWIKVHIDRGRMSALKPN